MNDRERIQQALAIIQPTLDDWKRSGYNPQFGIGASLLNHLANILGGETHTYQVGEVIHLDFPDHQVDAFYKVVGFGENGQLKLEEVD
jgi:hypothetical protein